MGSLEIPDGAALGALVPSQRRCARASTSCAALLHDRNPAGGRQGSETRVDGHVRHFEHRRLQGKNTIGRPPACPQALQTIAWRDAAAHFTYPQGHSRAGGVTRSTDAVDFPEEKRQLDGNIQSMSCCTRDHIQAGVCLPAMFPENEICRNR